MEQSPSWDANSHSASQEIPRLKEPEGSLPCSQKPAAGPYILSQMNPVHNLPIYFFNVILVLTSHLCLGLQSSFFSSFFSDQNFVYISHLPHFTLVYR
jgi:hypothetical protein